MTGFALLSLVASMNNLQQYDYSNHEAVVQTVEIAAEHLDFDCIPLYHEATQELGAVKIPFTCGIEHMKNMTTGQEWLQEDVFTLTVNAAEYKYIRTNSTTLYNTINND